MRKAAILASAIILLFACNDDTSVADNADTTKDSSQTAQNDLNVNGYYKRYVGTIANVPVVLNLIKSDDSYRGTYYYKKIGSVLNVYGFDKPDSTGAIIFGESAPTERDEEAEGNKWSVIISDSTIKGKWYSEDKTTVYDVDLKEDLSGAVPLAVVSTKDSMRYKDSMPSPAAICRLQYIIPANKDDKGSFLEGAMKGILACKEPTEGFGKCMDAKRQEYYSTYKADLKDVEAQGLLDGSYSYNFAWVENQDIYYNMGGWLCLCVVDWSYTGGAHGNYSSQFYCIDMLEQKHWNLKDVIADTVKIIPLIEKNVRKQFNIQPRQALNSRLFVDEMYATNNFFITDKGITFVYTSYEIASYADGEVSVFIPFDKITNLLTPAFKTRMGMNTTAKAI